MRFEKTVPLLVRGANSYSANLDAQITFADVPRLPGGENYVRGIRLYWTSTWAESAGGAITVPELFPYLMLDRILLAQPNGHRFYDLNGQAGACMRNLLWFMRGRRPQPPNGGSGGALTINTGDVTRQSLYLPFSQFGSTEQDDLNVPLRDLFDCQLLVGWPNLAAAGGIFDTGANDEGISAATLTAEIELIVRDDYVASSLFTIGNAELSGVEENLSFCQDRLLSHLMEVPVQASNSLTENFVTDAERDEINLLFQNASIPTFDRIDARDAIRRWNALHAITRDEELSDHEGNASPWVPLFYPGRRDWKASQLPRGEGDTKLRVTGTDTTPRVVYMTRELNREETVLRRVARNGARVPKGFAANPGRYMTVSTKAKSSVPIGADGAQRFPVKIHQSAVDGTDEAA